MKRNGIFITGTDTGVGKTFVACSLIRVLRDHRADIGVMKPVETGCRKRGRRLVPGDGVRLISAAGVLDPENLVVPYKFRTPLAPYAAAMIENRRINLSRIRKSFRCLSKLHEFLVVEGAGGLFVPLTRDYTFLDFIKETKLSVVIVAGNKLGVLNHIMLTVFCLKKYNINPELVILNNIESPGVPAQKTNLKILKRLLPGIKVLNFPYMGTVYKS
ncbi:MAG TPA: dethiobiotin synthase [bacterium]